MRGRLVNMRNALERGSLTIGFIGGSITDGRSPYKWPEPVLAWLCEQYPHVRITVENAAIGATGSDLAVFRAERDLISRGCDIVFVEYAVNDSGEPTAKRMKTREGLLRKLLASGTCDVALAYTYIQVMYKDMAEGRMPASVEEFERLADHYGLNSVWMGKHAFDEVRLGRLRWEEWLPDGLHPTERGSYSYAQSVIELLKRELAMPLDGAGELPSLLPEPLDPLHWGNAWKLPFDAVKLEGPWTIRRYLKHTWIDQAIYTSAVGAKLSFSFRGRGVTLGFDFGKQSAEFRYRLDGGEWKLSERDRPAWCGNDGWFRLFLVADDLDPGEHSLELEVVHGDRPDCTGTNFTLGLIGIID